MPLFTVGTETHYDRALTEQGRAFKKLGRNGSYPGGFAVSSPADGQRLIKERGKQGVWAVYELEADWDEDTAPSQNGWWHALVNDSIVLRKVEP